MIEQINSPDDLRQLVEIEEECFHQPLSSAQIARLLEDPNTCFLAERRGDMLLGSVWVQTVLDEGYIGNVAVRPAFRRRGIGDVLLNALDVQAGIRRLSFLTLEARAGNEAAISLYEKHGYSHVGHRPGYYTDPKEDAILMTKRFSIPENG